MGKRIEIEKPFCLRCGTSHKPGEHLAKPKKAIGVVSISKSGLDAILEEQDGVALQASAHPRKRGPMPKADINQTAIETIEAPASIVAAIDEAAKKKRTKALAKAMNQNKRVSDAAVLDEIERKRALKTARQARWRAKHKKPKKKKKAKK